MKGDIVPYDKETGARLADVLQRLGVPTIGPLTGHELLKVCARIDTICKENAAAYSDEMLQVLRDYEARLLDVCHVSAEMQKIVIEKLQALQAHQHHEKRA